MKDIELPPLPDPKYIWHDADDPGEAELFEFEFSGAVDGRCDICERLYSGEQMSAYARAAIEADRAQRVPDGWANLLKAAREVLSWTQAADRPPARDEIECGRMTGVRVHALADLHEAVQVLASTPAPAQQEPSEAEMVCAETYQVVGCLLSDLGLFETEQARKILDNLSEARRVHQDVLPWESAQHQEQPQQERGPMTDELLAREAAAAEVSAVGLCDSHFADGFVSGFRRAERHHGIRKD